MPLKPRGLGQSPSQKYIGYLDSLLAHQLT